MKVALYHGFLNIHFEMLGYLLDYFINCSPSIEFDIYSHTNTTGKEWKDFYDKHFQAKDWLKPIDFEPIRYDLIFIITDDDNTFKKEWYDKYYYKIISIDHFVAPRNPPVFGRIGTRFFNMRPMTKWALPCYEIVNKKDKIKLLKNNKIKVCCIGIQNRPPSVQFLIELFENFHDIEFHIITRKLNNKYIGYSNIITHENCPTDRMMEIFKDISYVLCLENPNNLHPVNCSISAAIPMAFNFGCQLIIPSSWQVYYNFNSVITYYDTLLQKNQITSKIKLENISIDLIYEEQYKLVNHRNNVIDSYIRLINPTLEFFINNNTLMSKIIKSIKLVKPNSIIVNNLSDTSLIYDFRQVYINNININNITDNYKNVYIYGNLKEIILRVNEPCVLYYDNHININELKLFGERRYIDYIIINHEGTNVFNYELVKQILVNYGRQSAHYISCITQGDKRMEQLIIVPQL